ncbi:MAG: PDZ domain-containing protein [Bacillota bacterium]|jgi:hypothetical protein|nr:PDZ domain-containing protein [Bacillota bacterium]MDD3297787.1 PDZ domain-containing protein [Bacillota bacterium]MDD3850830.1 PDZ domain-containing protein [Bacillota bacterium]MDD4707540.1 PDZ domain-containing protein [Bacillota bacterium]
MFPFVDLIMMVLQSIITVFINPLFWVVLVLVYNQYKKGCVLEERMLGKQRYTVWERMSSSIAVGMAGGLVGSIVMVVVGVTLDNTGILYVWVIAIILMMINPRYMCFSYAGGLVALSSLAFGFPEIDVPALMAIVAILHLVESVLIFLNGSKQSIPVFMEDKNHGVVGAFNLMRFWPIPIIIMTVVIGQIPPSGSVPMPDWWPLIKPMGVTGDIEDVMFLMLPVVAALGYSDIAITETPAAKSRHSAINLFAYSVVLLGLSVISSYHRPLQWLAAIFGPAFHELLIVTGRRKQKKGVPIFVSPDSGVRVLDVFTGGPADKMGLSPGDIIIGINGRSVEREEDLSVVLEQFPSYIWLDRTTLEGQTLTSEFSSYPTGLGRLEMIVVPKESSMVTTAVEMSSPFKRLLRKLRKKRKKD